MLLSSGKKEIAINLTNLAENASTDIPLFYLGSITSFVDTDLTVLAETAKLTYSDVGTNQISVKYEIKVNPPATLQADITLTGSPTITDVVNALNAEFIEQGEQVAWFWYEDTGTFYNLLVSSSKYTFGSYQYTGNPLRLFQNSSFTVIANTSSTIEVESNVSYEQACNDLSHQPYLFTTMSVYADTIAQTNSEVTLIDRFMYGTEKINYKRPRLMPEAQQTVIENIPLWFVPTSLSYLQYTLQSEESVTLIISYTHKELTDMAEILNQATLCNYIYKLRRANEEEEIERVKEAIKTVMGYKKPIPKEVYDAKAAEMKKPNPLLRLTSKSKPKKIKKVLKVNRDENIVSAQDMLEDMNRSKS